MDAPSGGGDAVEGAVILERREFVDDFSQNKLYLAVHLFVLEVFDFLFHAIDIELIAEFLSAHGIDGEAKIADLEC